MKALPIEVETPIAFTTKKMSEVKFSTTSLNFSDYARNYVKDHDNTAKVNKKVVFPFILNDEFGYSTSIIENSYFIFEPQLAREFQLSKNEESKKFSGAVIEKIVFT
jgi:hypothetical protein